MYLKKGIILFFLISFLSVSTVSATENPWADQGGIDIELYPNPAVDYIIVEIKDTQIQEVRFELRSMIGNSLIAEAEEIQTNKYRISMKEYASGYYFLVIKGNNARFRKAQKFLKK